MKLSLRSRKSPPGMTLIEVTIALGLVSFCIISLMGLFPTILKTVRDSREKTLAQRMYQTVTEDLHENPVQPGLSREYSFDQEGFLIGITPPRAGQTFRNDGTQVPRFTGFATNNVAAEVPGNHVSDTVVLSRIQLKDLIRHTTLLQRPIWTTRHE